MLCNITPKMSMKQYTSPRLLLIACIILSTDLSAQSPPRLYIANDDHTDYLWTGTESQYQDWFIEMLDYYIAQADGTANDPPDVQGRFNADGNFWLWTYEKHKSRAEFDRLLNHIRTGHITIPLQTLVLLYGGMPTEAVLRSMYYAGRIERTYNLKFDLACAMENQTLPYGLSSLWAGSGAKYSWRGVCGCSTKLDMYRDRPREIYHAEGPDGRSVLMKWNSLYNNESVGGYAEARHPRTAVNIMTQDPGYLAHWPWSARALFGKGWDDQKTLTDEFITTARDMSDASRRVIVSNQTDFFKDFETHAPAEAPVPTYSGGFGNEWDIHIASMAEVSATVKRSMEELRCAEALAAIVSLEDPSFMAAHATAADSAFVNLGMYYEHNWMMDGVASGGRTAFQRRTAGQIQRYVSGVKNHALQQLSAYIPAPAQSQRFVVFNPLGWSRTDIVDLDFSPAEPVRVIDVTTNTEARSQIIQRWDRTTFLRVLADDVPAVGYKVFEVQKGVTQYPDSAIRFPNDMRMESADYGIRYNLGRIISILDKNNGNRELALQTGPNRWLNRMQGAGGLGDGSYTTQTGPVSGIYEGEMGSNFGGAPHRVRISLHKGIERIDIENVMDYYSSNLITRDFAVNIANFTVRHEEVGAIATAKRVRDGGSYSEDLARTDWLTMNHFVDISNDDFGMTISNWDSPFFQLGNSTVDSLDTSTPAIRAVIAARFDNLGALKQDGEPLFTNRYAIRCHGAYNQSEAMRFSLEHQNPLVGALITGTEPSLPATSYSLLNVSDPNCLLWALKPSEEGLTNGGIIARVWNLADAPARLTINTTDRTIVSAFKTTHIETTLGPVSYNDHSLTDLLVKQMMQTYRLQLSPRHTGIEESAAASLFVLEQNYPNPFSTSTSIIIHSSVQQPSNKDRMTLRVFDPLGRIVLDLTDEARRNNRVLIHRPQLPSSGVYFYRLATHQGIQTRMMLLR